MIARVGLSLLVLVGVAIAGEAAARDGDDDNELSLPGITLSARDKCFWQTFGHGTRRRALDGLMERVDLMGCSIKVHKKIAVKLRKRFKALRDSGDSDVKAWLRHLQIAEAHGGARKKGGLRRQMDKANRGILDTTRRQMKIYNAIVAKLDELAKAAGDSGLRVRKKADRFCKALPKKGRSRERRLCRALVRLDRRSVWVAKRWGKAVLKPVKIAGRARCYAIVASGAFTTGGHRKHVGAVSSFKRRVRLVTGKATPADLVAQEKHRALARRLAELGEELKALAVPAKRRERKSFCRKNTKVCRKAKKLKKKIARGTKKLAKLGRGMPGAESAAALEKVSGEVGAVLGSKATNRGVKVTAAARLIDIRERELAGGYADPKHDRKLAQARKRLAKHDSKLAAMRAKLVKMRIPSDPGARATFCRKHRRKCKKATKLKGKIATMHAGRSKVGKIAPFRPDMIVTKHAFGLAFDIDDPHKTKEPCRSGNETKPCRIPSAAVAILEKTGEFKWLKNDASHVEYVGPEVRRCKR